MEFCKYRHGKKCWCEGHYQFGRTCNDFTASVCPRKENPFVENIMNEDRLNEIYRNARKYGDL